MKILYRQKFNLVALLIYLFAQSAIGQLSSNQSVADPQPNSTVQNPYEHLLIGGFGTDTNQNNYHNIVTYSGKVAKNGVNFNGVADFTFSIIDNSGTARWTMNPNNLPLGVSVSNGRYLVLLGDEQQGMTPIPADLFLNYPELFIKVTVDLRDGEGFRHLTPDQKIASTPHALSAEITRGVLPNAITLEMLDPAIRTTLDQTLGEFLAPKIVEQPTNLYPNEGDTVKYSINVRGNNLTFQWKKNGTPLPDQNQSVLSIANYNPDTIDGIYSLEISNKFGTVETQTFRIGTFFAKDWEKTFENSINDVIPTADKGWLIGGNSNEQITQTTKPFESGSSAASGGPQEDITTVNLKHFSGKITFKQKILFNSSHIVFQNYCFFDSPNLIFNVNIFCINIFFCDKIFIKLSNCYIF